MADIGSILSSNEENIKSLKEEGKKVATNAKRNIGFIVGSLMAGILAVVFAMQIITGIFALVLSVGALAGGWYGWRWFQANEKGILQKIRNEALKERIKEAQRNAIEQLKNALIDMKLEFEESKVKRNEIGGQVRKLAEEASNENNPKLKAEFETQVKHLEKAYENVKKVVELRKEQIDAFEEQVQISERRHNFSEAAGGIAAMMGKDFEDLVEEQLSMAAFEAIDQTYHANIVTLENAVADF